MGESYVVAILLGISVGTVSGLLPGFGNLISMLLLFPFISHWNPIEIFLCYAALTQISQFVGSLTTLYTGIPGETSSMPVVIESKKLNSEQLSYTVAATAIGSTVAGIFATIFCLLLIPYLIGISWFYRTEMAVVLLLVTSFLIVTFEPQKKSVSLTLLMLGVLLGMIGWNNTFSTGILTFGIMEMYQGIPLELVMIFLFAVPQLLQISNYSPDWKKIAFQWRWPRLKWTSIFGHSVVGFIGGLVPGMTTVLSSQWSYAISSRLSANPYDRIVASETANNAGAISQLIPMLVIGLPLVTSEALTLALMEAKGFLATPEAAASIILTVAPLFLMISIAGGLLAWPLANYLLGILRVNGKLLRKIILGILLTTVFFQAYNNHVLLFYTAVSAALIPIAWLIRNHNTIPLVFGFLISSKIWDNSIRLFDIYLL